MKRGLCLVLLAAMLSVMLIGSAAATTAQTVTPYYGDMNRDGAVTTADVRTVLQFIVGEEVVIDEPRADYTEDTSVDSVDARFVLRTAIAQIPAKLYLSAADYSGAPYIVLEHNQPRFSQEDLQKVQAFEEYAPLDTLGRCGTAFAYLSEELMPDEERESISSVTPTGWHNTYYDFVSGGWVFNRAHLIGFQLAGEQANERNLITGTRYLNVEGMLPFENMVADYIKETGHGVWYRVTPIFKGNNLLAEGVTIEALSAQDEEICFFVFCYNVQDGVTFDYATGENYAGTTGPEEPLVITFILNTKSKKFHDPACRYVETMAPANYRAYGGTREALIQDGYTPCGTCDP